MTNQQRKDFKRRQQRIERSYTVKSPSGYRTVKKQEYKENVVFATFCLVLFGIGMYFLLCL